MSDPRDRVPWKFALLVALLAVASWLLPKLAGCGYDKDPDILAPAAPLNLVAVESDSVGLPGYKVSVLHPNGQWSGHRDIVPGLVLKTTPGVSFLRFWYANDNSPLFGYSWPDIPTCWEPPGRQAAEGAWRVNYATPDDGQVEWPGCDRQEMNVDGWNVTGLDDRYKRFWLRVEHWDVLTSQYRAASPWFELVITSQAEVDEREFERGGNDVNP